MTDSPADILAFTPVSLARTRHDGWTAERQQRFIEQLSLIGLVSAAAKAVGMTRKSAYALRQRPGAESFAAAWDDAVSLGATAAEWTAIERAIYGEVRPVFYRGTRIGERTVYNNRLVIAALGRLNRRRRDDSGAHGPSPLSPLAG